MIEMLKILTDHGGIYGIVIFGMGAAIFFLWRHLTKLQEQLIAIQELRVTEAKEVRKELTEFSDKGNQVISELAATIMALKDGVYAALSRGG